MRIGPGPNVTEFNHNQATRRACANVQSRQSLLSAYIKFNCIESRRLRLRQACKIPNVQSCQSTRCSHKLMRENNGEFGSYRIVKQGRLNRAYANVQPRLSFHCSHWTRETEKSGNLVHCIYRIWKQRSLIRVYANAQTMPGLWLLSSNENKYGNLLCIAV